LGPANSEIREKRSTSAALVLPKSQGKSAEKKLEEKHHSGVFLLKRGIVTGVWQRAAQQFGRDFLLREKFQIPCRRRAKGRSVRGGNTHNLQGAKSAWACLGREHATLEIGNREVYSGQEESWDL